MEVEHESSLPKEVRSSNCQSCVHCPVSIPASLTPILGCQTNHQLSDQLQIQEGLRDRGHILKDTGSAGSVVQAIARSHYFLCSHFWFRSITFCILYSLVSFNFSIILLFRDCEILTAAADGRKSGGVDGF